MTADKDPRGFGLYVHWPFCLSKCPYCDFNSHVRERIDQSRWRVALLAELDHYGVQTEGRPLTSIFFGGGTPSLMEADTVAAVLERARSWWPFDDHIEINLEANPTSVERERLADFHAAGINRLSLGVQSLDDAALRFLGRNHDSRQALDAVAIADDLFDRYSFDLIYARPDQSVEAWTGELRRALEYAGDHMSVYQLTIEPGTIFHAMHRRGELQVPDGDQAAALYEATTDVLETAGMPAYEISNHARRDGACRHNLTYWRYGDYAGIGPGAHGRLTVDGTKAATRQHRAPEVWLDRVERDGHATQQHLALDSDTRRTEMTLMGLRLATGLAAREFEKETGIALHSAFAEEIVSDLVESGFLESDANGLRATAAGRQRLDAITSLLLA